MTRRHPVTSYSCREGYHEHCTEFSRDCECDCHAPKDEDERISLGDYGEYRIRWEDVVARWDAFVEHDDACHMIHMQGRSPCTCHRTAQPPIKKAEGA